MPSSPQGQIQVAFSLGENSFSASGSTEVVEAMLAEFKQLLSTDVGETASETEQSSGGATRRKPSRRAKQRAKRKPDAPSDQDPIDPSQATLPQLLAEGDFGTNDKVGAAIVIWAEAHEGHKGLSKDQVEAFWGKTTQKKPSNLPRDLRNAVKKGWIEEKDGAYFGQGYGRSQLGLG